MSKNPLLISLRDQPHREGTTTDKQIEWTVPAGWSTQVLTLPAGTVIPLDVRVTSVSEGVYVEVRGDAALEGQCVRCLEPVEVEMEIDDAELYTQPGARGRRQEQPRDIEVSGDDMDASYVIQSDAVDLEPLLRDAILSEAPLQPICSDDCQGICEHCGVLLKEAEPGHSHEFVDPRFAALASLLDSQEEGDAR